MNHLNNYAMLGLGLGPMDTETSTTTQPNVAPKVSNWLNIIQEGVSLFKTIKPPATANTPVIPNMPAPAPGMSTTTKILIGTAAAAAVGTIAYLAFGRKKKGLGCTEPAPTLGGVKKQRSKKRK